MHIGAGELASIDIDLRTVHHLRRGEGGGVGKGGPLWSPAVNRLLMVACTTAALLFEEKGIESAYSQIFSATSDRIGNVLQLALNEQL